MGKTVMKHAQAGMAKKHDVLIAIEPAELGSGVNIEITSPVFSEFGPQIEATVRSVLLEYELEDLNVKVADQGAMDFTIRARTETAVCRAVK